MAKGSRLPCTEGVRVGVIPQAFPFLSLGTGEPDEAKVSCPVRGGTGSKGSHDLARGLLYLRGMPAGPARERPNAPPHRGGTPGEAGPHPWSLKRVQFL